MCSPSTYIYIYIYLYTNARSSHTGTTRRRRCPSSSGRRTRGRRRCWRSVNWAIHSFSQSTEPHRRSVGLAHSFVYLVDRLTLSCSPVGKLGHSFGWSIAWPFCSPAGGGPEPHRQWVGSVRPSIAPAMSAQFSLHPPSGACVYRHSQTNNHPLPCHTTPHHNRPSSTIRNTQTNQQTNKHYIMSYDTTTTPPPTPPDPPPPFANQQPLIRNKQTINQSIKQSIKHSLPRHTTHHNTATTPPDPPHARAPRPGPRGGGEQPPHGAAHSGHARPPPLGRAPDRLQRAYIPTYPPMPDRSTVQCAYPCLLVYLKRRIQRAYLPTHLRYASVTINQSTHPTPKNNNTCIDQPHQSINQPINQSINQPAKQPSTIISLQPPKKIHKTNNENTTTTITVPGGRVALADNKSPNKNTNTTGGQSSPEQPKTPAP